MDAVKDSTIQIRVSRILRDQFKNECDKQGFIPAEWIRNKIIDFVKEEQEYEEDS